MGDAELISRVRDGDPEAFAEFFRAHYASVLRFLCRYTDNIGEAEDVAQEIFVFIWERRETLDPARSVRAFLLTMAHHRLVSAQRRHHREVRRADLVHNGLMYTRTSHRDAADADVLVDELDRVAARWIAGLPDRQREIFELSRSDGLAPAEIAHLLGISTQTVYVQLGRATKTLYEALEAWIRDQ